MPNPIRVEMSGQIAALRLKARALSAMNTPEARIIAQLMNETAEMMDTIIGACTPHPALAH